MMKFLLVISTLSILWRTSWAGFVPVAPTTDTKPSFLSQHCVALRATVTSEGEQGSSKVARVASDELLRLFNSQVTRELSASQLYLSASIWLDQHDLVGMATYMRGESDDERRHALDFIDFANKRDIPLRLEALEAPASNWDSVESIWQDILDGETANTQSLLELADAAMGCQDHAVSSFLMPYHMEQVNSEDNLRTILSKVRDESRTPGLIRQLDTELGGQSSSHSP